MSRVVSEVGDRHEINNSDLRVAIAVTKQH